MFLSDFLFISIILPSLTFLSYTPFLTIYNGISKWIQLRNKQVIILRGVPGIGKKRFIAQHELNKNRSFYIVNSNKYLKENQSITPLIIEKNRVSAMKDFLNAIKLQFHTIYICDTNQQKWMYENYKLVGRLHNYNVHIIEFPCIDKDYLKYYNSRSASSMKHSLKVYNQHEIDNSSIYIEPYIEKFSGDSLPFPKKTKQELNMELNNILDTDSDEDTESTDEYEPNFNNIDYTLVATYVNDIDYSLILNRYQVVYM